MKNQLVIAALLMSPLAYAEVLPNCSKDSEYRKSNPCQPVAMVVRHAEDAGEGTDHYLTGPGKKHADLYPTLFDKYVYGGAHSIGPAGSDACVCPIRKILAIDPVGNTANGTPSPNPYNTIKPLADNIQLPIEVKDYTGTHYSSAYAWSSQALLNVMPKDGLGSVVIAWDKRGLFPLQKDITAASAYGLILGNKPLLKAFPKQPPFAVDFIPERNHFYVFANQDKSDGKFAYLKMFKQEYLINGQWITTPFLEVAPDNIQLD